jgi:predicted nuclease of predicted toxin-antitoxin system
MVWRQLPPNPPDASDLFKKRTRLLIDESLGQEVAIYLRSRGYSAVFTRDVGLSGRSDEEIFAYAWRHKRMLWTHDRDFLDDSRFPEHRNPGVVVLPGGAGDSNPMAVGLNVALAVFGSGAGIWSKTKSTVSPTGGMTIRSRDADTGKITARRYRLPAHGTAEQWHDME